MQTKVTFFDLGSYDGADSVRFVENMQKLGSTIEPAAFLIEANPELAKRLPRTVAGCDVTVENFAVSSMEGRKPFYLAPCDEGSSIYESKHGCKADSFIIVEHKLFTRWIRDAGLLPKNSDEIWILKANIEGAEWDLINDLENASAWSWFDIYCGPAFVVEDMQKCSTLVHLRQEAYALIQARAGVTYPFAVPTKNYPLPDTCVDLGEIVRQILSVSRREVARAD